MPFEVGQEVGWQFLAVCDEQVHLLGTGRWRWLRLYRSLLLVTYPFQNHAQLTAVPMEGSRRHLHYNYVLSWSLGWPGNGTFNWRSISGNLNFRSIGDLRSFPDSRSLVVVGLLLVFVLGALT